MVTLYVCVCVCVNLASSPVLCFKLSHTNWFFSHFIHVQAMRERDVTAQYIMWVLIGSRTGSISGESGLPLPLLLITVPHTHTHTFALPLHYTSSRQPHKTERSLCISTVLFLTLTLTCKSSRLTVVSHTP